MSPQLGYDPGKGRTFLTMFVVTFITTENLHMGRINLSLYFEVDFRVHFADKTVTTLRQNSTTAKSSGAAAVATTAAAAKTKAARITGAISTG